MENFVQGLINMNPEQIQAWVKEQALYGPPPGQELGVVQPQPQGQVQAVAPQPSQAPQPTFSTSLAPGQQGQGLSLPVTTNGVSAQQAPLSAILGGYNG